MRRACIDIGSNTTRLLVADDAPDGLSVVHERRAFTRIGAAMAGGDTIPEPTCAAVTEVIVEQLREAIALGVDEVHAVGTAAVRGAANRGELVARLRAATGLTVSVLAPATEARLAFVGAAGMHGAPLEGPHGVLDVGGGSSEAVVGRGEGEILWWTSLPLGSGSLTAAHLAHDPPSAAELAAVRAAVTAAGERVDFDGPAPERTFAVGGSATSLRRLAGDAVGEERSGGAVDRGLLDDDSLDGDVLDRVLTLLAARPSREIAARSMIDPVRTRLLPAGVIVLQELGARIGGRLEIGRGGVREGVLLEARAR